MRLSSVQFSKEHNIEFYKVLRSRVNAYFKINNISRYGNWKMYLKTILILLLYIVPYILILTVAENLWFVFSMWLLAGVGTAGIGMCIMHDANHGAYSKNPIVNTVLGFLLNMVGGSDVNWRIQHNVLHHTYTNVDGMDEDIDVGGLMRFSPNQPRAKAHKYQHLYAWFLYGLMTLNWFFRKDVKQAIRYKKQGLIETQNMSFKKVMTILLISKVVYFFLIFVLPFIFAPVAWYISVIGFVMMQFTAGLFLSVVFQSAHVLPRSNYPVPDESGNIKADWAVNQLYNTANFAPNSKLLSWYVGGLNFQVEHHLFPNVCHVHYKEISKIVKATALEYNLPYYSYATFTGAIKDHIILLKRLGRYDNTKGFAH